ncbi:LysR family transcriptional regulator [Companilactobacillus baiquanensis]|uniref:LysR family transcriptional regulator n=1 Tax=Companilactobacillus baiquanensis TaxID=2486005 RepID=A0ABW1UU05_9LACO|nr:LysR family transcriptional regulator [Companilactobacillus baiquanensis]
MNANRILLQILKTVDYSQTISDVASQLYLSQPYISKLLKETESTHNVVLVNRTKPIELTDAGKIMVNGLQAIIDEEDRLNDSLNFLANQYNHPIRIGVTDPFMSSIVTELATKYYEEFQQKVQISLLTDITNNKETLGGTDILIGRRLLDSRFEQIELPQRQLNLFVTNHCNGYQPDHLYQKFSTDFFDNMNMSKYVGLSGCDSFQHYVDMSFKKENIKLFTTILVPSAADALRAVNNLSQATTITTFSTAKQTFPNLDFNLIPLPAGFISLDTTINFRSGTSSDVKELVQFLRKKLLVLNTTAV